MPREPRMVLGPQKWTLNLHVGEQTFIAYEGMGPNASVASDDDIPRAATEFASPIGGLLRAKMGTLVKRPGAGIGWEVPLLSLDDPVEQVALVRIVAQGGRQFTLFTNGPDKEGSRDFIESFMSPHGDEFKAARRKEHEALQRLAAYKEESCACTEQRCVDGMTLERPPMRGGTAEQDGIHRAALACLQKIEGKSPSPSKSVGYEGSLKSGPENPTL